MAGSITSTNGIYLTAVFFQALLQGMGLLQGFLYFVWYHTDTWSVKGTVVAVLVLECIQMGAAFGNIYVWFVTGFGDFDNLNTIHRVDMVELTAMYLSIFVAQAHFARCIYQLHKQHKILPILILLLSLTALGCGLGQVVLSIQLKQYSALGKLSVTDNLQASFALAADVLITFGLCWRLNKNRGGIQSTNKILNFLIMTAINRGVFTMIFAALNMILFITQPQKFYFMIAILLSDKFYMNSMLAMLNTREYTLQRRGRTTVEHISMPVYTSTNVPMENAITVTTVNEIHHDK
ncbi:hypothetical protein DFH08DRAFT_964829 [Mycena albidolilacea]|uniref:DUF6534 domain-containing protein n=1 Tax=Mycena albidolilacea TaxID=1033008 RepID=A0AAD7EN19_9AGAR|nr:hypothetical protein DFH08DRAFT_964829 [Mycena albidolilacea]